MSENGVKHGVDMSAKMETAFAGNKNRKPIKCPECKTLNPGTRTTCKKCKAALPVPEV